jgi:D-alanine-D-alanine ligase
MRIGLTYDLAADWSDEDLDAQQLGEFDSESSIQAIAGQLAQRGHTVRRIGRARALIAALHRGTRWDIVFNICEGLRGPGREALVPALLEEFGINYVFSDSLVLALTLHKGHTKRVIRDAGIATADFRVLDRPDPPADLHYPLFVKPVAEGSGKGVGPTSLCGSARDVAIETSRLIARYQQPVLVERYLPGREFTVGIVGTGEQAESVGVMEIVSRAVYGFATKKDYADVRYILVDDSEALVAKDVALRAWCVLGCRDGGRVDLRSDESGQPMFLEVNPLPGLHPVTSDLCILADLAGRDYAWLFDKIMRSACARAGLDW